MKWNTNTSIIGTFLVAILATSASAQIRVVNYNIAKLNGDHNALADVFQAANDDDSHGFATPVSVYLFQEVTTSTLSTLQGIVGPNYSMATFTDQGDSNSGGAQAMFYLATQFIEDTASHTDIYSQAGRHADRWRLDLLGYSNVSIYFYGMHLKASWGTTNEEKRRAGAEAVRDNIMTLPAGSNVIAGGDMNFYSNSEPAYQWFTDTGNGQLFDPLGGGSWNGTSNAIKHTQSPLANQNGALIGGGLDDRFDFQFLSPSMIDGAGLSIVPGSHTSLGNDGQHYNIDINSGNNSYFSGDQARGNALADALWSASDHIPVIVDYQIPALLSWQFSPTSARVLVGAATSADFSIQNMAQVVDPAGADTLNVEIVAVGDISGVDSASVPALSPPQIVSFPLDTSIAISWSSTLTLTVTSQDAQSSPEVTDIAGEVIEHANASFQSASDIDWYTHDVSFEVNTGIQSFNVLLFNYQYTGAESLLDIDSVAVPTPPIMFDGMSTAVVGSIPSLLTFHIDTDAVAPNLYLATVPIDVSDEDIPGELNNISMLNIRVDVTTTQSCVADIAGGKAGGDGVVDVNDLLALIADWGEPISPADITGPEGIPDGTVDIADLLTLIAAWGPCP